MSDQSLHDLNETDEELIETSGGWACINWSRSERLDRPPVLVGVPVTVGADYATTLWMGEDESRDIIYRELDYWLGRLGIERVGRSSSSE